MTRARLRVWHADEGRVQLAGGDDPGWVPDCPPAEGRHRTPGGTGWFVPVPEHDGLWLEVGDEGSTPVGTPRGALAAPLISILLAAQSESARLWDELSVRYAEIDLLYAISEILGQTVRLEEAARTIIRQVARVVGARRASIMVHDEAEQRLRVVASLGFDRSRSPAVASDDPMSLAARAYREQRVLSGEAGPATAATGAPSHPAYRGNAYLVVPISYAAPGAASRPIGVINLTDALNADRFTGRDRKLVTAVAAQVGAAIENARLAAREREQQRLEDELELAHDLQQKLMPDPEVLQGEAQVAVRCLPVASVGGDFYTFQRLAEGRIGIMLGDVSTHGLSAALVMALVLAAAGIHTAAATGPAETLRKLRQSLLGRLSDTEMYASTFYAVLDRKSGRLRYANAGHPHAFLIGADGTAERLEATAPPLGLGADGPIGQQTIAWDADHDLLCLWTDGLVDAESAAGERFGEGRLLRWLVALHDRPVDEIVATVMGEVERHAIAPADDRTLLVLRS